ncbi:Os01g0338150 [Oryza sativa Japonica Group]|uniref:Os01g0338150 protein n=1 Tax=Oryza sativa subsp. japonica TaxID=39947 RepID=A0A0P0V216_ORYSJ|nr:hypothetical protein EE612_002348 [Oryza sativa]BAS71955.1 Os01g0338150 [Oryza sativa Japonica Group]
MKAYQVSDIFYNNVLHKCNSFWKRIWIIPKSVHHVLQVFLEDAALALEGGGGRVGAAAAAAAAAGVVVVVVVGAPLARRRRGGSGRGLGLGRRGRASVVAARVLHPGGRAKDARGEGGRRTPPAPSSRRPAALPSPSLRSSPPLGFRAFACTMHSRDGFLRGERRRREGSSW